MTEICCMNVVVKHYQREKPIGVVGREAINDNDSYIGISWAGSYRTSSYPRFWAS